MTDNPLLPHNELRELHRLVISCSRLDRKHRGREAAREALLAGTSMHLERGDLLCTIPGDTAGPHLARAGKKPSLTGLLRPDAKHGSRLLFCAAAAHGMQAAGTDRFVLAFANAGAVEQHWKAAMKWAQEGKLPLILACNDATGGMRKAGLSSSQHVLDFEMIRRFTKQIQLPVFPVDGGDAVAVFRVMQECALRARFGGGPAVLWSVLAPVNTGELKPGRSASPIARLESYMTVRKIPLD